MKKVAIIFLAFFITSVSTAYSCGIVPLQPLMPLGCTKQFPVCYCDNNNNCQWIWVCS